MKPCFKCGRRLPLEEFYPHKQMADGHLNKCKECAKRDVRRHRSTSEEVRAYDRARAKTPARRKAAQRRGRIYRTAHKDLVTARSVLYSAIRSGRIRRKPCSECGAVRVEAHHPDHSMPLDVVWLCALHHRRLEFAKGF